MTHFTKLALAGLALGVSLTPALAEPENFSQSPLGALTQSLAAPAGKIVEGRQATPIATPATTHETGAARYLDNRVSDQDR